MNEEKEGSKKWEEQNAYTELINKITIEIRDDIIEKWLNYVKSENLT